MTEHRYRGRFAPTPSGPLHAGSLLAALASYCDARQQGGRWHIRIDDIDPPRVKPGASEQFAAELQRHGLIADAVVYQSQSLERYRQHMRRWLQEGRLYLCRCTRRELPRQGPYPGTCRHRAVSSEQLEALMHKCVGASACEVPTEAPEAAIRLRLDTADDPTTTKATSIGFVDRIAGQVSSSLDAIGDQIVWRRDGVPSYALACAIDDALDASDVVRGADLLSSTLAQLAILQLTNLHVPRYAHLPLLLDDDGRKLGKQTRAKALAELPPLESLATVWARLGQQTIGSELHHHEVDRFVAHATRLWDISRVPPVPEPNTQDATPPTQSRNSS